MLATLRDDTLNVLNMQHIIRNSIFVALTKIKGPAHMVVGDRHLRNRTPSPNYDMIISSGSFSITAAIFWQFLLVLGGFPWIFHIFL